jgi:hypothetical protein
MRGVIHNVNRMTNAPDIEKCMECAKECEKVGDELSQRCAECSLDYSFQLRF